MLVVQRVADSHALLHAYVRCVRVQCTKYVLKPGPGAGKVVYEIEHVAYTCVPRLTVADFQSLSVGKAARITLLVKNTVERDIRIRLRPVNSAAGDGETSSQQPAEETKEAARSGPLPGSSGPEVWAVLPSTASCDVRLSDECVWLPAYDEIAEESGILQEQKRPDDIPSDNPNVSDSTHNWQHHSLGMCTRGVFNECARLC